MTSAWTGVSECRALSPVGLSQVKKSIVAGLRDQSGKFLDRDAHRTMG